MIKAIECQPQFKIFVGALPGESTENEIIQYFGYFGSIGRVTMFYHREQKIPNKLINRGFCHIRLADSLTLDNILSHNHIFQGRKILCSIFKKGKLLKQNNNQNDGSRVIVKNIPSTVSEQELQTYIQKFGKVKLAYFIRNPEAKATHHIYERSKIASIQFDLEESVDELLQKCPIYHGNTILKVERYVHNSKKVEEAFEASDYPGHASFESKAHFHSITSTKNTSKILQIQKIDIDRREVKLLRKAKPTDVDVSNLYQKPDRHHVNTLCRLRMQVADIEKNQRVEDNLLFRIQVKK